LVAVLVESDQGSRLGRKLNGIVGDVVAERAGNERIAAVGGGDPGKC
jgi:hypothetical protein